MSPRAGATALVCVAALSACAAAGRLPADEVLQEQSESRRSKVLAWTEVPALLGSGRVIAIVQLHDLTVTLTTREGEEFVAREPSLDAIFTAVRQYAPNADSIVQATE